jgi:hypothetical protein
LRAGRRDVDVPDCEFATFGADGEGVEVVDVVDAADMLGVSVEDIVDKKWGDKGSSRR